MKLLIVINSLSTGGAEKLLIDTIPRYHKEGFDVTLCLLNSNRTPFLETIEALGVCQIIKLKSSSVYHPKNILGLRRLLKSYDLVHAHLFPTLYWLAFANMFRKNKATLFFTEHNTTNRRTGLFFKWIDHYIYSRYTKVIAIAEPVANFLNNRLTLKKGQLELIYNGIDIATYSNAIALESTSFGLTTEDKVLIQVSSFTEQKDQETLIQALALLPKSIHLFLVGDGPRRVQCEQLAQDLRVKDRVHFLGIRSDVPNLLKMAHVIVLSSYYEGLSLSSMEALASGVPFIASDVPGLGNVVRDAGLLFDQGNEKQLASHIEALLNDITYANSVAQKGYERAQLYSIDHMVAKHVTLYKQYGKA